MPTKKAHSYILPTLQDLVDAGAHFGHRRSRSHPKARQYVYTIRDRFLVLNLEHTQTKLGEAIMAAESLAAEGKLFLFVGTKPQASAALKQAAETAGQPYINQRWLGGTLTNYETIRRNLKKLERLEEIFDSQEIDNFTKKERVGLERQKDKLIKIFGGIRALTRLPDVMVVVDIDQETIAVGEAQRLGIPVIAIADTNVDPTRATYPIPANDDSRRTIELILGLLATAIADGVKRAPVAQPVVDVRLPAGEAGSTNQEVRDKESTTEKPGATKAERMAAATGGDHVDARPPAGEAGITTHDARDETPTPEAIEKPSKKTVALKKSVKKAPKKTAAKKVSKSVKKSSRTS